MPVLTHWEISLDVRQVLRAQGADPDVLLKRNPLFFSMAEKAIALGTSLLHPRVLFDQYKVKNFRHQTLELIQPSSINGRFVLSGQLIAEHLAHAESVLLMICTLGPELERMVSSLFQTDPLLSLSLDAAGSAAVEILAIQACNHFEKQFKEYGMHVSMPLNPGMVGWPLSVGQPEIFSLLDFEQIGVTLNESWMMLPNKTLSVALGVGKELSQSGSACQYCSLNGVCQYQQHYSS